MVSFCLLIISRIYGILVRMHHFFYKVNLLKRYNSEIPVASVGNITLGGTGKTPFAIMLAERLAQKDRKVSILIRGYGEDEWKMLEDKLEKKGIKVLVGRDRVKSAKKAEKNGIEILILDDGFQHWPLKRDLEIVLIDSTNPFGNGFLFPRGILREPLDNLKRADIIVLSKVDKGENNISMVTDEVQKIAPGKRIVKVFHRPKNLLDIREGQEVNPAFINNKKVCLVSAICDASYFRYTVEKTGASVGLEFIFPDHYPYRMRDLERIFKECEKKKIDTIITTEKDAVKLKDLTLSEKGSRIFALGIELEVVQGEEELDTGLHRLHMRRSRQAA